MRKFMVLVFIIAVFFYIESAFCLNDKTDPYPNISIPVYSGAYEVHLFKDREKKVKSIDYYVRSNYPSHQLLEFYKNKLKKFGLKIKKEEPPKWECFVDAAIKGSPKVRQLVAIWVNRKNRIEAILALRFKQTDKGWDNILNVKFQLQPLFDMTKLKDFIKELKSTGDKAYNDFMNLLDKYRGEDGEVDIDKAISQNKGNKNLLKYKKILEDMRAGVEK
jgi:hypothetical protein